jgi:hypothetical protein
LLACLLFAFPLYASGGKAKEAAPTMEEQEASLDSIEGRKVWLMEEAEKANIDWRQFEGESITIAMNRHWYTDALEPYIEVFEGLFSFEGDAVEYFRSLCTITTLPHSKFSVGVVPWPVVDVILHEVRYRWWCTQAAVLGLPVLHGEDVSVLWLPHQHRHNQHKYAGGEEGEQSNDEPPVWSFVDVVLHFDALVDKVVG